MVAAAVGIAQVGGDAIQNGSSATGDLSGTQLETGNSGRLNGLILATSGKNQIGQGIADSNGLRRSALHHDARANDRSSGTIDRHCDTSFL